MRTLIQLPARADGTQPPGLPDTHQVTLVGAPGAGKSRFMLEMQRLAGGRAYRVSAIDGLFGTGVAGGCDPGSVRAQYREALEQRRYLRDDAATGLDMLVCLLLTDEFEHLLDFKTRMLRGESEAAPPPTRLDRLRRLWESVFPANRIVRSAGSLMFATASGDDLIDSRSLSRGEQTVLYHIAAMLYAPRGSVVFVEDPSLFVHPSILNHLWNELERLRPDCRFVYDTVDVAFVGSRTANTCVWVRRFDASATAWDYDVLPTTRLSEECFVDLIGTRRPVLFIEGDAEHSIDARLYSLVFADCTVRPLGSCDKVIETTRAFRDMQPMHRLDSRGIVDRDRRTDEEVEYLRRKGIDVPEVAEVENIFLTEGVVRAMAAIRRADPDRVAAKVRQAVMRGFGERLEEQALQHVRHRVKRQAECRIDARFSCITAMELHLSRLVEKLQPRRQYDELLQAFRALLAADDYAGVLKVFNHKPMLPDSGVAELLGYPSRDAYIAGVLNALRRDTPESRALAEAVRSCFTLASPGQPYTPERPPQPSDRPDRTRNRRPKPKTGQRPPDNRRAAKKAQHKRHSKR